MTHHHVHDCPETCPDPAAQVARLVDAYGRMLRSLDPAAVLPAIVDLARQFLVADAYAVWRHEPEKQAWRIVASEGLSEPFRHEVARMLDGSSPQPLLQRPTAIEDALGGELHTALDARRAVYRAEGIRALLVLPLQLHGERAGTLVFYYRAPRRFAQSEIETAAAYANLAASALTSSELFHAEQRARSEAESARREADMLRQAAGLLASTLDLTAIYDTLRRLIVEQMPCDSLIVSSFDAETRLIRCSYAWVEGCPLDPAGFPTVPLAPEGSGMQSQVIHSRAGMILNDIPTQSGKRKTLYVVDPDGTVRDQPDPAQPLTRSMLLVPILLDQQVLGVVQVHSCQHEAFTPDHLRLLEALVLQMAAASRNAYLYEQAQKEIRHRGEMEEELRRSEVRFRTIIEQSPFSTQVFSPDGWTILVNRAWEALWGVSSEQLGDYNVLEDPQLVEKGVMPYLRRGFAGEPTAIPPIVYDVGETLPCLPDAGDRRRWVSAFIYPVMDPAGRIREVILVHEDVSERVRSTSELEAHAAHIRALNERLRRAMTETHHRVKNNLQIMAAMVDMQAIDAADSERGVVPLSELERLGTHIRTLAVIHELLTERAREDGRAEHVSARAMLEKLLPRLEQMARGGGRSMRFSLDDAQLTSRQATSLALVTNELVSNAIKYGRRSVEVEMEVRDGTASLCVRDDGPGFPPEFDPAVSANTGLDLVENLSRWDLDGSASYRRARWGGEVVVRFPVQCDRAMER